MNNEYFFNVKKKKKREKSENPKKALEDEKKEIQETWEDIFSMSGLTKIIISVFVTLMLVYPFIELMESVSYLIYTSFLGIPTWTYTFQDLILLTITILISLGGMFIIYKTSKHYYNKKIELIE